MTSAHLETLLRMKASLDLLIKAEQDSLKAAKARAALEYGSSRARVTTANAKWMRASEDRDRKASAFSILVKNSGY